MKLAGWAALLVCATAPALAQSVKDLPKPTDYVSDYAHVMSPATIAQLDQLCSEVDHEAHAKILVLTINTTNGEPIQQYAVDLEDAWKAGYKGSDRSVILVLAVQDRKRFIETGYGLEGILPDGKVGDIGRQMVPMLRANDFDGAVTLAVDEMSQIIAQNADIQLKPLTRWGASVQRQPRASLGRIVGGIVFLILVAVFLLWAGGSGLLGFLLGMFFGGGGWGGGGFGGGGGDFGGGGGGGGDGFDIGGSGSTGGGGAGGSW